MDIYSLLLLGHLIGTILGVGGATMIEFHLSKALADGQMTLDERGLLGLDFVVVRVGLVVALFTGIGFIAMGTPLVGAEIFWAKLVMIVIVAINALLLQAHAIGLYWGSALSFVTWWMTAIMGSFLSNGIRFGFLEIMFAYVFLVVGGAFVLHKVREYIKVKHM